MAYKGKESGRSARIVHVCGEYHRPSALADPARYTGLALGTAGLNEGRTNKEETMPGRREARRDERQDDRSFGKRDSGNNRYQMRSKLVSIGDDYWIENEGG